MISEDEYNKLLTAHRILEDTYIQDKKLNLLITKLIPNYKEYEDKALAMIKKYGLLKALVKVKKELD